MSPRYKVFPHEDAANYFLNRVDLASETLSPNRFSWVNTLGWGQELAKQFANPRLLSKATTQGAFPSNFVTDREIEYIFFRASAHRQAVLPISLPVTKAVFGAWLQIQDAVIDPKVRATFISDYKISEKEFWQIVKATALIDTEKRMPIGSLALAKSAMYGTLSRAAYLQTDCSAVVRKSLNAALQKLHILASKTPMKEPEDLLHYQPGDDIRRLDWKAYGRTDRFLVRGAQVRAQAESSPLHVAISAADSTFSSKYYLIELVQYLQKDNSRTIYLGHAGGAWVKLTPGLRGMPPGELIDRLPRVEKAHSEVHGIRLPDGSLPKNLLYVSNDFMRCLANDKLYSSRQCRIATIWLNDPALFVWPQVRQSWIDAGK
jgi:hypothetical protein